MAKIKEQNIVSIEEKLRALYRLQTVDSKIDNFKILRGELPLEVQDLEDELEGLNTRISKYKEEILVFEKNISERENKIIESNGLIKKYKEQQNNVRNNREYDALSKEIEFQELEIELSNKKINEFKKDIDNKKEIIEESSEKVSAKQDDLEHKRNELNTIIEETKKEEEDLLKESQKIEKVIEERLLVAYKRIRENARNGLAVVKINRDACGGCFNKIPPQRQLDIKSRKKIIVCEYCGRILIDDEIHLSLADIQKRIEAEKLERLNAAKEKPKRKKRVKKQ